MSKKQSEKYLEKIPVHPEHIMWFQDDDGMVTLNIENKGVFYRLTQKLLKKPKVSHIHLDEIGSFIWPLVDGNKNLIQIGEIAEQHFGDKIHPTYERLTKYFQILESYKFIEWK